MNNLNKYIWLIDTLNRKGPHGLTFDEIDFKYQNALHISDGKPYVLRTFHNHRRDIERLFGIRIVCNPPDYRYRIADAAEVDSPQPFRHWLLQCLSVNNTVAAGQQVRHRIAIDDGRVVDDSLPLWLEALRENRLVSFTYAPFWSADPFERTGLAPYCLNMFNSRWYVIGRLPGDNGKAYALDRMTHVVV